MGIEKDDVLSMPEGERYIRFCVAVQEHQKAGFPLTQAEIDRMAAMFKVTAPQPSQNEDDGDGDPIVGTWGGSARGGYDREGDA